MLLPVLLFDSMAYLVLVPGTGTFIYYYSSLLWHSCNLQSLLDWCAGIFCPGEKIIARSVEIDYYYESGEEDTSWNLYLQMNAAYMA